MIEPIASFTLASRPVIANSPGMVVLSSGGVSLSSGGVEVSSFVAESSTGVESSPNVHESFSGGELVQAVNAKRTSTARGYPR